MVELGRNTFKWQNIGEGFQTKICKVDEDINKQKKEPDQTKKKSDEYICEVNTHSLVVRRVNGATSSEVVVNRGSLIHMELFTNISQIKTWALEQMKAD